MLGASSRRWQRGNRAGGVPALPPALLRPVHGAVARRHRVQGVPAAQAGRAWPRRSLAQAARRPAEVAAVPQLPDVRGEIGRVQLHQMQVLLVSNYYIKCIIPSGHKLLVHNRPWNDMCLS